MVFIFYGEIDIAVGIDRIRPVRTGCVLYQPIIGGISTLFLHFIADDLQLIFCRATAGYDIGILNIPSLIIKTCYIITGFISSGCVSHCLTAHGHTAGFHCIRSGYRFHVNVLVEFYADFRIVAGLGNFRRNVIIAVNGDFRT